MKFSAALSSILCCCIAAAAMLLAGPATAGGAEPGRDAGRKPKVIEAGAFKDCADCPEMLIVPAGSFAMGSPADEDGRALNEEQITITFVKPFAAGRYPVTFAEWDACVADGGCDGSAAGDAESGRGKLPVVNVSWDDARAYADWLSRKTGKRYRLLSESEREYLTRAGSTTPYWWGRDIDTTRANIDVPVSATDASKNATVRHAAVAVDSFKPNAWGFFSVHGNVWEWTEDCWNEDNRAHPADGQPLKDGDCGRRAARGGSWNDFAAEARAAARFGFDTGSRNGLQGFRIARDL